MKSEFDATLPTSTRKHNIELDRQIIDGEPIGRFELLASWAQRVFATLPSSLNKWLGSE
jgi:hypothetical protein